MARTEYPKGSIITGSGSDVNINHGPTGMTRFLDAATQGLPETIFKSKESKMAEDKQKVDYYNALRQSGYSSEQATSRINEYNAPNLIQKILGQGNKGNFQPPANDPQGTASQKAQAELDKTKAETRKFNAQADAGGFAKRVDYDTFTTNQLQSRLKALNSEIETTNPKLPENENKLAKLRDEKDYVNNKIQEKSGYQYKKPGDTTTTKKKPAVAPVAGRTLMMKPDGSWVHVKDEQVSDAESQGYSK